MVVKGTVQNALQPGISWTPRQGRLEEKRVQILAADLPTWEATLQDAGYEYRFEPIGQSPLGIISYKQPQDTQPDEALSDTWAVRYITEQRSIWYDDLVQEQMQRIITIDNRSLFRGDIERLVRGETERQPDAVESAAGVTSVAITFDTIVARAGFAGDASFIAMTQALVDDLLNGADSQFVSTPALVRTSIWPAFTALDPTFQYVNALLTTSSLLAYETTLPTNLVTSISGTLPSYYWASQAPTLEQQDDGRWRYSREYWGVPRIARLQQDRIVTPT